VKGRLLVEVAAVVCTAGVVTVAAVVGPSVVEATAGTTTQLVVSFIDWGQTVSAPATLGTMANDATAKLDAMIILLAHIVSAFL
jgi:hypothetical protein